LSGIARKNKISAAERCPAADQHRRHDAGSGRDTPGIIATLARWRSQDTSGRKRVLRLRRFEIELIDPDQDRGAAEDQRELTTHGL